MSTYGSYANPTVAEGLADPSLALNVGLASDYSTQMAFLDISKSMRAWTGLTSETGVSNLSYVDLKASGVLDANGWPTFIPEGVDSIKGLWAWNGSTAAASYRAGTYVLEYEGEGELDLGRYATILSKEPGRIVFSVTGESNLMLNILSTDPDADGNYIRDISIVREDHIDLYKAGAVFNPQWLAMLDDVRQMRFMDWNLTNDSDVVEWGDRLGVDNYTWGREGVPVEMMVKLANELGSDAWFSMPAMASHEYIREFATYVRDHLDPGLTATVEFSNETWNWGFDQPRDIRAMADADWGVETNAAGDISYTAKLATEMALIWQEVFAEVDHAPGLIKVIGTQTGVPGRTKALLEATAWFENEPDTAVHPADVFDAVAVTTYFGNATSMDEQLRADLFAAIDDPEIDAFDWLAGKLMDPDYASSIPQTLTALQAQKDMAESYGLGIVSYEGGQHVHHMFGVPKEAAALGDFFAAFVRSPQMADLYGALWDGWAEIGDGPFMQFGAINAPSKWGSFALWSDLLDTNPRAELLTELNETTASWWEGSGPDDAYLQGVTRTGGDGADILVGTDAEDYLIGGAGDDVLIGGAGNDGLNGGDGYDLMLLSGTPEDYEIAAEGDGYRLTGPDGSDFVINIEEILFEDDSSFVFEGSGIPEQSAGVEFTSALTALMLSRDVAMPDQSGTMLTQSGAMLGRSDLVTIENNVATASDLGNGVMVLAVQDRSAFGSELSEFADNVEEAYTISARYEVVEIGDHSVSANYWTLMSNLDGKDGATLADTALGATGALAAVVWDMTEIQGSAHNDVFQGRGGNDVFSGGAGNDTLIGRAGNDRLRGGAGNDTLNGGDGEDIFIFGEGDGRDLIKDFSADDQLDVRGLGLDAGHALQEFASLTEAGDLMLDFGGGDSIIFEGVDFAGVAWMDALV